MELRRSARSCKGFAANVINIVLDRAVEPSEIRDLQLPEIDYSKGVVLTGKAPIWLYAALIQKYNAMRLKLVQGKHDCDGHYVNVTTPWIGVFDPRLGVVVVESHIPQLQRGEVFQWDYDTPEQMPTS